jgi:hypothetical protein
MFYICVAAKENPSEVTGPRFELNEKENKIKKYF